MLFELQKYLKLIIKLNNNLWRTSTDWETIRIITIRIITMEGPSSQASKELIMPFKINPYSEVEEMEEMSSTLILVENHFSICSSLLSAQPSLYSPSFS